MIYYKWNRRAQIISLVFLLLILFIKPTLAEQPSFEINAKSAILMETETGDIIYKKNPNLELPPASMTKIMTMLLIMEAIEEGKANLKDKVIISEKAASMGGSQVFLEAGEEMDLETLMKAIAIASANDASLAVAEYIYGTGEDFVKRMNERAQELGLKNTYFYNTNGLPPDDQETEGNYTSALDLAIMSRELLKYPKVLDWTSTWIDYIRDGTFVLNNTNWLVRHYKGADGLKTGYTNEAKYCVTATAKRDGLRFLTVIMGGDESQRRFQDAAELLSYGFNTFKSLLVSKKGETVMELQIRNGKEEQAVATVERDLIAPVRKGEEDNISKKIIIDRNIKAPIKKGTKIGEIKVFKGNLMIKTEALVIDRDVEKASILNIVIRILREFLMSLINLFQ
jgi:serine-type D-Ala-D-Ala carboxypeptidase (penicillin-binding protein 5/6)